MKTLSSIALAAALSAISTPTLAADDTCSVCGDPLFPVTDSYAPALAVKPDGGVTLEALRADPTWPAITSASPAIVEEVLPGEGTQQDPPVPGASHESHAAVTGRTVTSVATR